MSKFFDDTTKKEKTAGLNSSRNNQAPEHRREKINPLAGAYFLSSDFLILKSVDSNSDCCHLLFVI